MYPNFLHVVLLWPGRPLMFASAVLGALQLAVIILLLWLTPPLVADALGDRPPRIRRQNR
ncbi:hypothetical protein ACIHEI_28180 [Kitasatospora sp. NPDC051984]|uniref:hypothetical protein n=1 Tax=Kitasatospora sp. NPDC051984 TaxID=3364059 RepID=UPI0037CC23A6